MKTIKYPTWLVPIKTAKKLKEIGISDSEILACNDGSYGWYKGEQMYYRDRDGDTYTALEASEWKDSNLEPTYTWEQVFEWFRDKGYNININYIFHSELKCAIGYEFEIIYECERLKHDYYFDSYHSAMKNCLEELIKIYKSNENSI